ncbi:hypothetical protein [Paraconexibacter algicola]|uniref:Uncharacterized protein n=1 Tax=Paraconexibacter algicola TaxID=2133960 RepID=A0A2T4UEJ2_9ACTN|nr:hypothetical protein [Paraconexibacter algicola]PTL56132.1 hypothetical protein C7Y72_14150 [Paraconexibacter algicola]
MRRATIFDPDAYLCPSCDGWGRRRYYDDPDDESAVTSCRACYRAGSLTEARLRAWDAREVRARLTDPWLRQETLVDELCCWAVCMAQPGQPCKPHCPNGWRPKPLVIVDPADYPRPPR